MNNQNIRYMRVCHCTIPQTNPNACETCSNNNMYPTDFTTPMVPYKLPDNTGTKPWTVDDWKDLVKRVEKEGYFEPRITLRLKSGKNISLTKEELKDLKELLSEEN